MSLFQILGLIILGMVFSGIWIPWNDPRILATYIVILVIMILWLSKEYIDN